MISKSQCPKCADKGNDNSKDNLVEHDDGSLHCYACGYHSFKGNIMEAETTEEIQDRSTINHKDIQFIIDNGVYRDLKKRKLDKRVCVKYGIRSLQYNSKNVLAFPHYKNGCIVGFKLKYLDGTYQGIGDMKGGDMFGAQSFDDPTNRTLVITEGELDAASCSQVLGDTWHCTSLQNGANSAKKFVEEHYDKLSKYNNIVLSFDNGDDSQGDAGRKGVKDFIGAFNQIGKVRVATLPMKDANEMLQHGKAEPLKWALIKSETYKPKQIVNLEEIMEDILVKPIAGRPWPWKQMTDIDHGFYEGKTYLIGSATDVGKTTFIKDLAFHLANTEPQLKGGLFFLEHRPVELMHKLLSSKVGQDLEQPDTIWWDKDRLRKEVDNLKEHIFLFDPTMGIDLKEVIDSIYYFVNVNKVSYIVIDNLTILSENRTLEGKKVSENEYLVEVGKVLNKVKRELGVSIFIICHLSQDKISKQAYVSTSPKDPDSYHNATAKTIDKLVNKSGLTWESGRMPSIENLYGGATSAKLANEVWVLARDTTNSDDFIFRTTTVKCLKCKNQRRKSKRQFDLVYDTSIGKLVEFK
jgi:twinkle protein